MSPSGEVFELPGAEEYTREFERLRQTVDEQRSAGKEIVVVMGVGFVGAVMAGVVADAVDAGHRQVALFRHRDAAPVGKIVLEDPHPQSGAGTGGSRGP